MIADLVQPSVSEPSFYGAAGLALTGVIAWGTKWAVATLVEIRDSVRGMRQTLHGSPDDKEDRGLVGTVEQHETDIKTVLENYRVQQRVVQAHENELSVLKSSNNGNQP